MPSQPRETDPIGPPDSHHLLAALGWLELGLPAEAGEEIARITSENLEHPDVLEVRWEICAAGRRWDTGLQLAERLLEVAPERSSGWIHRAYAMRRAAGGGLERAWEALRPAVEKFPDVFVIPYNLACYAAQLGRLEDAWGWLQKAVAAGAQREQLRAMALVDSDLEALWPRIREW